MMKIYLSADIEGITGTTHWNETDAGNAEWEAARQQMTAEVAAACQGALEAGATEIWVKDSHDTARNLIAAELPQAARLIRGWSGHPFLTLQELDNTFAAVALIGYHSPVGSGGSPLAHSFTGKVTMLKLNGRLVSEFLMDALTSAYVGVPLVFLSGDQGICEAALAFNPSIQTVAVKQGVGASTINLHPALALERIRQGMAQAVAQAAAFRQPALPGHFVLEARYRAAFNAYHDAFYPGAQQIDSATVRFESDNLYISGICIREIFTETTNSGICSKAVLGIQIIAEH